MDDTQNPASLPADPPAAPSIHRTQPAHVGAHLTSPNQRRGRGKPFQRGDLRIGRVAQKMRNLDRKLDRRTTASLMHELTTNALLAPSPNGAGEARIIRIIQTIADKAEAGDLDAAEMLINRFAGKVKSEDEAPADGGRIVIEWNGPPLPWMPGAPVLPAPDPAIVPAIADEPEKGYGSDDRAIDQSAVGEVIDAEVVSDGHQS